jgi:hypothetical protein
MPDVLSKVQCVANVLSRFAEAPETPLWPVDNGDRSGPHVALPACAIEAHQNRIGICELCAPMTTDPHMQPLPGSQLLSGSTVADPAPPHQAGKPKLKAAVAKQSRERLVLLSMGLVTAAAAATCYVLLEYSPASSVLAGGGIWAR